MRRRAGVLGLVVTVLLALWWWHRSRETSAPEPASKGAAAAGAGHESSSSKSKTASLHGRVTRAMDGAPIREAFVAIKLQSQSDAVPTLVVVAADPDGRWTSPVAPGTYTLGVSAEGYLPERSGPVEAAAHSDTETNTTLTEGGAMLRGTVSDVGGGAIGGARVVAEPDDADIATLTKADGSYRLSLPPGYHALEVSHDDYLTASSWVTTWSESSVHDFKLVPGGTVRGVVVARDTGKPVSNAVITVATNRARFDGRTEAASDGTFTLHHVPAGDFALYANAAGYVTTRPTDVSLGIGDTVDARLVADQGFTLRGRIVSSARPGEGVAGVVVDAHTDAPVPDSRTRAASSTDGSFEIDGLAPARYTLTASGDAILAAAGTSVSVTHDVDNVQIAVTSGVTVRGRIDPPEQVELAIGNHDGRTNTSVAHVTEDANGTFTATNVPPGTVEIEASTAEKSGAVTLHVGTEDQSGVVIALQPSPSTSKLISGTVVDEANMPIPRAYVEAGVGETTFADDAGRFELHGEGPTPIYASFGVADRSPGHEPIMRVVADKDLRGLIVKIPSPQTEIRGRVIGTDGMPARDVWVRPSLAQGQAPVLTGADGSFVLDHLRKGTYDVNASAARGDATAVIHDVATGTTIEIKLAPVATLHGRVTMGGAPVAHYDLRCEGVDYFERRIDAVDGAFTLEHVRASDRSPVECRAATEGAEGHASVVFDGSSASVAIELTGYAAIAGSVVDVFKKQPVTTGTVALRGRVMRSLFASPVQLDGQGRFFIDHAPADDVRIQIGDGMAVTEVSAHPLVGQVLELGPILIVPPASEPGDLGIYVGNKLEIRYMTRGNDPQYAQLHVGDTITDIDGVPANIMPGERWRSLFSGNAERGHTYALTLARGVTVNITAE